ncbi:hypothetical protein K3727_17250 [Rhodobacteraceae bacterium M382]|nr:hypothetical protein K3727_17250 [Rhodobacteraceae bacterium M382]
MSELHNKQTNTRQCLANLDNRFGGLDGPTTNPLRSSHGEWIGGFFWSPLCEAFGAKLGSLADDHGVAHLRGEERLFLFNHPYLTAKLEEIDNPKIESWLQEITALVSDCSDAISSLAPSTVELKAEVAGGAPLSCRYVDQYGALVLDVAMTVRRYLKKQYAAEMVDARPGVIDEVELPELSELRKGFWTKRAADMRHEEDGHPDIPF